MFFKKKRKKLTKALMSFDGIYVETNTMRKALEIQGFNNVYVMPNFKDLNILKESELVYHHTEPYRLCTFSRVMKEKGIEDAKALGKYLRDVDFQCAFTSPFQRAIDTTKFILGDKNIVITSNDNFRELNFGTWEGRVFQDVKAEYPEQHYNLWNKPEAYIPVDGEYLEEYRERVRQGINDI